jgi:RNA polymerase sigma-70 factor (ECF subfamily)
LDKIYRTIVLDLDRFPQQTREEDDESFRKVFHAYYEGLCQYAYTLLRDMDDAEDIVQSMFLKLWEKRETLVITHTIKSYLYKAVYHQCVNQFDHRAVRLKFQERTAVQNSQDVQHPEIFPNELEERIVAAINSLPKQCRTIFMMSRYEEMKYAEIAKVLDISVNTIENQISKALKILRTHIKD